MQRRVVLDWNEPAKNVYKKMGAVHVGSISLLSPSLPSSPPSLPALPVLPLQLLFILLFSHPVVPRRPSLAPVLRRAKSGADLAPTVSNPQKSEWQGMRLEGEALAKLAE